MNSFSAPKQFYFFFFINDDTVQSRRRVLLIFNSLGTFCYCTFVWSHARHRWHCFLCNHSSVRGRQCFPFFFFFFTPSKSGSICMSWEEIGSCMELTQLGTPDQLQFQLFFECSQCHGSLFLLPMLLRTAKVLWTRWWRLQHTFWPWLHGSNLTVAEKQAAYE